MQAREAGCSARAGQPRLACTMLPPVLTSRYPAPPSLCTQTGAHCARPYEPNILGAPCFAPYLSLDVVEVLQRDHLQASQDGDDAEHDDDPLSILTGLVAKRVHELPGTH